MEKVYPIPRRGKSICLNKDKEIEIEKWRVHAGVNYLDPAKGTF